MWLYTSTEQWSWHIEQKWLTTFPHVQIHLVPEWFHKSMDYIWREFHLKPYPSTQLVISAISRIIPYTTCRRAQKCGTRDTHLKHWYCLITWLDHLRYIWFSSNLFHTALHSEHDQSQFQRHHWLTAYNTDYIHTPWALTMWGMRAFVPTVFKGLFTIWARNYVLKDCSTICDYDDKVWCDILCKCHRNLMSWEGEGSCRILH